jgi:hypothetical protein
MVEANQFISEAGELVGRLSFPCNERVITDPSTDDPQLNPLRTELLLDQRSPTGGPREN